MELPPAHVDLGLNLHKSSIASIRVNVIGRENIENYGFSGMYSLMLFYPYGIMLCIFHHLLNAPDIFPVIL